MKSYKSGNHLHQRDQKQILVEETKIYMYISVVLLLNFDMVRFSNLKLVRVQEFV